MGDEGCVERELEEWEREGEEGKHMSMSKRFQKTMIVFKERLQADLSSGRASLTRTRIDIREIEKDRMFDIVPLTDMYQSMIG